jgi:cell division transport system permease protein
MVNLLMIGAVMAATDNNRDANQRGASGQKLSFSNRWRAYKSNHRTTLRTSFNKMLHEPLQTILTVMVIAIALTLPAALYLTVDNVQQLGSNFESSAQITVFVQKGAKTKAIQDLESQLTTMPAVASVDYISAQQALLEFKALSGFGSALRYLEDNPLPAMFLVQPRVEGEIDLAETKKVVEAIGTLPVVDDVQVDMAWLQRLHSLIEMGHKLVLALGITLGIGVLLVIGNTIRLAIESRRDEIIVVKLVGGTNAYVRRPFLYTGLLLGLLGALIASIMLFSCLLWMSSSIESLASLYQSQYRIEGLGVAGFFTLMLLGAVFGLGGAWIAVSRHLRDIEPK